MPFDQEKLKQAQRRAQASTPMWVQVGPWMVIEPERVVGENVPE